MPISVTISSTTGTFQDGTYTLGSVVGTSTFASVQVNSLTFGSATFISTNSPAGANGVLIAPPSSNLVQLTLKGITGDTGIPLAGNQPAIFWFFNPSAANAVGLASAGSIAGVVTLTFF